MSRFGMKPVRAFEGIPRTSGRDETRLFYTLKKTLFQTLDETGRGYYKPHIIHILKSLARDEDPTREIHETLPSLNPEQVSLDIGLFRQIIETGILRELQNNSTTTESICDRLHTILGGDACVSGVYTAIPTTRNDLAWSSWYIRPMNIPIFGITSHGELLESYFTHRNLMGMTRDRAALDIARMTHMLGPTNIIVWRFFGKTIVLFGETHYEFSAYAQGHEPAYENTNGYVTCPQFLRSVCTYKQDKQFDIFLEYAAISTRGGKYALAPFKTLLTTLPDYFELLTDPVYKYTSPFLQNTRVHAGDARLLNTLYKVKTSMPTPNATRLLSPKQFETISSEEEYITRGMEYMESRHMVRALSALLPEVASALREFVPVQLRRLYEMGSTTTEGRNTSSVMLVSGIIDLYTIARLCRVFYGGEDGISITYHGSQHTLSFNEFMKFIAERHPEQVQMIKTLKSDVRRDNTEEYFFKVPSNTKDDSESQQQPLKRTRIADVSFKDQLLEIFQIDPSELPLDPEDIQVINRLFDPVLIGRHLSMNPHVKTLENIVETIDHVLAYPPLQTHPDIQRVCVVRGLYILFMQWNFTSVEEEQRSAMKALTDLGTRHRDLLEYPIEPGFPETYYERCVTSLPFPTF